MKIPFFRTSCFAALFLVLIFLGSSCKKTPQAGSTVVIPTVSTTALIENVTSTSAQSGGTITNGGNGDVTAYGIYYSTTNKVPTSTDSNIPAPVTNDGTAITNFNCSITGLTPNTTYYSRAYAINSAGTGYGSVVSFTTSANLGSVTATVTTFAGNGAAGFANGQGAAASFSQPGGITTDSQGNVYVSDSFNNVIRKITPDGTVSTFAGNGNIGYIDGPVASAEFYGPQGLAFDSKGNLCVSDLGNNVIRKISPAGVVSTYAGIGSAGYVDGAALTLASFNNPSGLTVDAADNIYVADRGNNVVRKIIAATNIVITLAGTKTAGYVNGTGLSASFSSPNGVAADASASIYVADLGNAAIRKITSGAITTTVAGSPSQTALFNLPAAVAFDKSGNLFVVDEGGRVLEYTTGNVLYTLAGTSGVSGFINGTGTAAQFSNPQGVAVDANGNIYVADQGNNCIRKITITTTQ
jgi:sugar lactone lactonase YvrE